MTSGRERVFLAAVLGVGLLAWAICLGPGPGRGARPVTDDWHKELHYYRVLSQAVHEGRIPWQVSRPVQDTRRFLAIPETTWSPQVVLLRWLRPETFVVVNTLLLFAAGYWGCLRLRRRFALAPVPFLILVMLSLLNGHLLAHIVIGHSMWAAAFLLPHMIASTLDVLDGAPRAVASLALSLFAIALQGGFHLWIWLALFLGLLAITAAGARARLAAALGWAGLLSLARFAPAAEFLAGRHPQDFFSGYPSAGTLLAGLVTVRPPDFPRLGGAYSTLNWWEYDAFVGWSGLSILVVLGLGAAFARDPRLVPLRHRALALPMLVLFAFSLGDLWAWMKRAGVPMLEVERVSSRFLLVPLVVLATLAAARLQALWSDVRVRRVAAALTLVLAGELAWHARSWTLAEVERAVPRQVPDTDDEVAIVPFDGWHAGDLGRLYEETVLGSAAVSVIALGAAFTVLLRARRRPMVTAPAPGP